MTGKQVLQQRARSLRKAQTPAENKLWNALRCRQITGVRFGRQRILGNYILDFYAPSLRLAIELDGGQHYTAEAFVYDNCRDAWLTKQGIVVLRFTNLEIANEFDVVLEDIYRTVCAMKKRISV